MMVSTREAYGKALVQLAERYDFYVLDADLAKATQTVHFGREHPERFLDLGIAESNLMSFAAGLSTCGTPVFASTFAAFAAGRAYDQVRNSIAYANCNVKIGATHGGVMIGEDGGSHQCIEDLALMRAIPGMTVICPADAVETRACVEEALRHRGPVYLRFGRFATPTVYAEDACAFKIGKANVLRDGTDVTIAAVGHMVSQAMLAAQTLEEQGVSAAVLDMASVKPIDADLIESYAQKTGFLVTCEDHNVMGGLGGAVAEVAAKRCPVKMALIGVQDAFGRSGSPDALAKVYGLDVHTIVNTINKGLGRNTES
jgi:transketolase